MMYSAKLSGAISMKLLERLAHPPGTTRSYRIH